MKYSRAEGSDGIIRYGIVEGNDFITIDRAPYESYERTGEVLKLDGLKLLSPVDFSKAVCIGLNYRDHAEEFGLPIPETPVVFMKPSTCQLGYGGGIIYPDMCHRLDYEAELAVVIGKVCHNVSEDDAYDYILGMTIANDVTARDLQPKNGQWTVAKCFDTFLPLGPYIETDTDGRDLMITSRVNGETKQMSRTSNLIFSIPYLVSYLSHVMTLLPGDVISTGTPGGISGMKKGDVVEIEIEKLGILRNTII